MISQTKPYFDAHLINRPKQKPLYMEYVKILKTNQKAPKRILGCFLVCYEF